MHLIILPKVEVTFEIYNEIKNWAVELWPTLAGPALADIVVAKYLPMHFINIIQYWGKVNCSIFASLALPDIGLYCTISAYDIGQYCCATGDAIKIPKTDNV